MHAAANAVSKVPSSDAPVSWGALRFSAFAGILAVVLVLTGVIVAPQVVAGQRVSGTEDVGLIRAYYAHTALAPLQAVLFPAAALILVLAVGLHAVASRGDARTFATMGLGFTIAIVPGYIFSAALQASLVAVATSGGDVLPLFRLWDVFYNSGLYTLEAGYVLAFSLALSASGVFPRWFRPFGIVVGLLQALNAYALWLGLPDMATMPGNVGMLAWLLVASLLLLKVKQDPARDSVA